MFRELKIEKGENGLVGQLFKKPASVSFGIYKLTEERKVRKTIHSPQRGNENELIHSVSFSANLQLINHRILMLDFNAYCGSLVHRFSLSLKGVCSMVALRVKT